MARLTSQQRRHLPDSAFALPYKRKLPLTDARGRLDRKHIGNAAARLSMMRRRRTISPSDYMTAHRAIARAERQTGMGHAKQNPAGDFVHDHPWMTFFLGLAAINTVGWLALVGIAAAKGGGSAAAPAFQQGSVIPIPTGTQPSAKIGDSLQMVSGGKPVAGTSTNTAVLAPASGVEGGFVAVAPGTATVNSADGESTVFTVVVTGTAGVAGAPRAMPKFVPRILRVV
jgi:hypothetical protein